MEAVIQVKKKKPKKVVKHEEPDPAKLELGKGPPADSAQTQTYDGGASPLADEVGEWESTQHQQTNYEPRYQMGDNDEFGNVWGRDGESV